VFADVFEEIEFSTTHWLYLDLNEHHLYE